MKKATNLISFLILMMVLVGCSKETVHIDFPFEVGDVENIEMYHYAGAPVSAEKKIVVAKTDITDLYHMFENLSLTDKQVEEITGADVTSFRFNLSDGTNYELVYVCNGVKNGKLKSPTGNFEYFTSSDIGAYWSNIDLEAVTVSKLASKLKSTLEYRDIITDSGHYAALVRLGDKAIAMSTDGVGSKILIAEMMNKYNTVGIDCIAMVVNDILCVGAEPIALVDYLAVEQPDPERAEEIAEGLVTGAKESRISIIGGETASLPGIIKDFDLAGTGIGFVDVDKIITGEDIEAGDVLIGIESNGIHSNGYSLARKALFDDGGFSIDDKMPNCDTTIGEELIRPTELYVKPIVALFKEEYEIHGLAHITGGGFTNLRRLKKGVGYNIYDLPEAPEIFKLIYQQNVPLEEMYKVFNMGVGFVVITSENEAEKIMKTLKEYCNCQIIGKVTDDEKITVKTFEGSEVTY